MKKEFLTVSELNGLIKEVIDYGFPQAVWVTGEVQNYNRSKHKNHIFFELCEKDQRSKDIVAKIRIVIFSRQKSIIDDILKNSENAFELKDDIEVKFLCKVDFYSGHGSLQLIVESIDPVYTLGKIAQERQRVIACLKKKGLLERNKRLSLSPVPLNIGLISSYDSAAYNDFMDELDSSAFGFKISFVNALMQGKGTEADVCHALDMLNKLENIDAIVITRGGGSIADLSYFDSQKIAERIANSIRPVLTGIGHEINVSVADMTAYSSAKTPTAIAQYLTGRVGDFLDRLEDCGQSVFEASENRLRIKRDMLKTKAISLHNLTNHYLKIHQQELVRYGAVVKQRPFQLLRDRKKDMVNRNINLIKYAELFIKNEKNKIGSMNKIVRFADPRNTMKRGFSITRNEQGTLIRSKKDVKRKDNITTEFADGVINSEVSK